MIREFLQRLHMTVGVQRHGRAGVAEPLRELDWPDPLLVPEACSPVPEGVRAEAASVVHRCPKPVPANPELEVIFERIREYFWYRDNTTVTLPLSRFTTYSDLRVGEIIWRECEDLAHAKTAQFHHHHRKHEITAEAGE